MIISKPEENYLKVDGEEKYIITEVATIVYELVANIGVNKRILKEALKIALSDEELSVAMENSIKNLEKEMFKDDKSKEI